MRTASKVMKIFIWILMVVYAVLQLAAIAGISIQNAAILNEGNDGTYYSILPLTAALLLMAAAVILFMALRRHRYFGLILGFVAAVWMMVVALGMQKVFAPQYVSSTIGLTTTKMVVNHIGIVVIPLLMIPAWLTERRADKQEELFRMMDRGVRAGDGETRIFLDDEDPHPRHRKRSVRKRVQNGK